MLFYDENGSSAIDNSFPHKRKKRKILLIMSVCFCLAAITAVILYFAGVFKGNDLNQGVNNDGPLRWTSAAAEPMALLKIKNQSNEITDIDLSDYNCNISCVKCDCEVLFFEENVKKSRWEYASFADVIYVPYDYREEFCPGSTVLIELYAAERGKEYYLPHMDKELHPEYLSFYEGKLVDLDFPKSEGFYLIKEVNKEIESEQAKDKWGDILYDRKLECGMSVEEVRDYLASIWPAAECYWNNFVDCR